MWERTPPLPSSNAIGVRSTSMIQPSAQSVREGYCGVFARRSTNTTQKIPCRMLWFSWVHVLRAFRIRHGIFLGWLDTFPPSPPSVFPPPPIVFPGGVSLGPLPPAIPGETNRGPRPKTGAIGGGGGGRGQKSG